MVAIANGPMGINTQMNRSSSGIFTRGLGKASFANNRSIRMVAWHQSSIDNVDINYASRATLDDLARISSDSNETTLRSARLTRYFFDKGQFTLVESFDEQEGGSTPDEREHISLFA